MVWVAICDYKKRFRAISYNNGNVHDARVYRISEMKIFVDSITEGYCVLGDPVFGGYINIKTSNSTSRRPLTREEERTIGKQRVIVENAFVLLKEKFKILRSRIVRGDEKTQI